jgi:3-hydroxyisobutyrate dehydrogenase-like beta-hydroxyacid dehydrogenase
VWQVGSASASSGSATSARRLVDAGYELVVTDAVPEAVERFAVSARWAAIHS